MSAQPKELKRYITSEGKIPILEWLASLRDLRAKSKINQRLDRIQIGNLGDYKFVGDGVYELRIDYGGGYRIYFGQVGLVVILLLCGGDKSTQNRDIRRAKEYWRDYEQRTNAS
jgi:putative addiction module killer protein